MKTTQRVLAVVLAVLTICSMGIFATAATENGKITITNASLGETYTVYKVFDALLGNNGAITYVYDGELEENDYFVQDANGFISINEAAVDATGNLTAGAIEFLATLATTATDSVVATASNVAFEGLEYGYYYVTSSLGSAVTIDSTNPEAVIIDKNGSPSIDKTVNKQAVTIGETLEFSIDVPLVHYLGTTKVSEYYVFDNMEDTMTYNNDVTVTIKNGEGEATAFDAYQIYTQDTEAVDLADDQDFLVVIPMQSVTDGVYDGNFLYDANAVVTISYTATVNELVKVGEAMVNYVELNWFFGGTPELPDVPPTTPDNLPTEPNGEGPSAETRNYSSEIKLTKVDGNGNILTGAKFSIAGVSTNIEFINKTIFVTDANGEYWMLKDGTYTTQAPIVSDYTEDGVTYEANVDLYDNAAQKYTKITSVTKQTDTSNITAVGYVDANGVITFTGLGAGTYTITELVAPEGYNLLTDAIVVEVSFDDTAKVFTATVDGDEATVADGVISFNVVNNAGSVLPGTGGIGTTIFYIVGGLLVLCAAIMLIVKRRAGESK